MVKEDGLDGALQDVHEIVVAADVCQFVKQKRLHLRGRQAGEGANRHQHNRPKPTDGGRSLYSSRHQQADRPGDRNAGFEPIEDSLPFGGSGAHHSAAKTFGEYPAAKQAQRERGRAGKPERDHPG